MQVVGSVEVGVEVLESLNRPLGTAGRAESPDVADSLDGKFVVPAGRQLSALGVKGARSFPAPGGRACRIQLLIACIRGHGILPPVHCLVHDTSDLACRARPSPPE